MVRVGVDVLLVGAIGGMFGGLAVATAVLARHRAARRIITRLGTSDPRGSAIVIRDGLVTISGQVGEISLMETSDITAQTEQTLRKVEALLAQAGTSKSRIVEARIWVKDIKRDFAAMNAVWNAWVDPENKGTRFCVEAELARPALLVEVQVVAACD
jgi:enamine deaminase RidA (YjgF/YER057c/UK114 family)